jgi:hypothetical protein
MEFPCLLNKNTELKEVYTKKNQSKLEFNISCEQALANIHLDFRVKLKVTQ